MNAERGQQREAIESFDLRIADSLLRANGCTPSGINTEGGILSYATSQGGSIHVKSNPNSRGTVGTVFFSGSCEEAFNGVPTKSVVFISLDGQETPTDIQSGNRDSAQDHKIPFEVAEGKIIFLGPEQRQVLAAIPTNAADALTRREMAKKAFPNLPIEVAVLHFRDSMVDIIPKLRAHDQAIFATRQREKGLVARYYRGEKKR